MLFPGAQFRDHWPTPAPADSSSASHNVELSWDTLCPEAIKNLPRIGFKSYYRNDFESYT
jgi:hypothetical protein